MPSLLIQLLTVILVEVSKWIAARLTKVAGKILDRAEPHRFKAETYKENLRVRISRKRHKGH